METPLFGDYFTILVYKYTSTALVKGNEQVQFGGKYLQSLL